MFIGQLAAVGAALCFSLTSTMYTLSGRKLGAVLVMRSSLPIAMILIIIFHLLTQRPLPFDVELRRWVLLGISGGLGFGLGAVAVLHAFVLIGPRLAALITASSPVLGSILGYLFLDEQLSLASLAGIALTISGIIFVISERSSPKQPSQITITDFRKGVLFAFSAALIQAIAFSLSSEGVNGDFDPLTGSLMRITSGAVVLWGIAAIRGNIPDNLRALRENPIATRQMSVGAITGPALGASLVLVSLQSAPVGITTALANLTPIFLIPISFVVFKERITSRAIIGTFIAVGGTIVLFMS